MSVLLFYRNKQSNSYTMAGVVRVEQNLQETSALNMSINCQSWWFFPQNYSDNIITTKIDPDLWSIEWVIVKCKYADLRHIYIYIFIYIYIYHFQLEGKCNVRSIHHHLRHTRSRKVHYIDLDLSNGPRSNVNTQIESASMTSYLIAIEMFAISVTICEIREI